MSNVLKQLSVAVGALLFVVVIIVGFCLDIPLLISVYRATVVMCLGSIIAAMFFRFFAAILYRFVAEQILQQKNIKRDKAQAGREAEAAGLRRE